MLQFGIDDYLVTPTTPSELQQMFGTPPMRLPLIPPPVKPQPKNQPSPPPPESRNCSASRWPTSPSTPASISARCAERSGESDQRPHRPHDEARFFCRPRLAPRCFRRFHRALSTVRLKQRSNRLAFNLTFRAMKMKPPPDILISTTGQPHRQNRVAPKTVTTDYKKLAITDELTGLYNGATLRHFLNRIIEKARDLRFPVSLLLFDIDNFKKIQRPLRPRRRRRHSSPNRRAHETLRPRSRFCSPESAATNSPSSSGKRKAPANARPQAGAPAAPTNPQQVLERFRQLLATQSPPRPRPQRPSTLTISGGLAIYPYDARTPPP